jgi:transcriptional regulator with XRE-family HTH domain
LYVDLLHTIRIVDHHVVDKELLKQFGIRIRELRHAKGLSQEQLAEKTGFHRTYIGMVERGERNLSLSNIAVLAKTFDMSVCDLLNFHTKRGGR